MSVELQPEFMQTLLGGMDANMSPYLLSPDRFAMGVNLTSRDGLPHTRPPFVDTEANIATGKFQGGKLYRLNSGDRFVFGVAGHVYALKLSDYSIIDHGLLLEPTVDRFYFEQADRYMVVQDGYSPTKWEDANFPVIIYEDGLIDNTKDSSGADLPEHQRVPKGSVMAYGHGFLVVATNYIYNSPGGAAPYDPANWTDNVGRTGFTVGDYVLGYDPQNVLSFTGTNYFAGGGRFSLPQEHGFIRLLGFQKNIMSGVGQGPLIVGAQHGFSAFSVNTDPQAWAVLDTSIILFSGLNVGTESTFSLIQNNADIIYRSNDGIRTLRQATAANEGAGVHNDPISVEVDPIMALDDDSTRSRTSGTIHDDRIFMTVKPNGSTFDAILSMDVSSVSSIVAPPRPIYDGVWTGLNFHHILTGIKDDVETLYAFAEDASGDNVLYKMDPDGYIDEGDSRPPVRVYTGIKQFASPFIIKQLSFIELWCSKIRGLVDITAYYRPDSYAYWLPMASGSINADPTGDLQAASKLRINPTVISNDPILLCNMNRGFGFQFCLQWTGSMQIDKVQFIATADSVQKHRLVENEDGTLNKLVLPSDQYELDDYEYRIV